MKGVHDLVHAASTLNALPRLKIILAGSTADHRYVDNLKKEIAERGLKQNVTLRGIISSDEILNELATCTCLVLPSYQETAPMVVQEAMAAGVPVLASNICGIQYQIENGVNGLLFPPGDCRALSEAMQRILSDTELCARLGAAAKAKATNKYRADVVARQTLDVYRRAIA